MNLICLNLHLFTLILHHNGSKSAVFAVTFVHIIHQKKNNLLWQLIMAIQQHNTKQLNTTTQYNYITFSSSY